MQSVKASSNAPATTPYCGPLCCANGATGLATGITNLGSLVKPSQGWVTKTAKWLQASILQTSSSQFRVRKINYIGQDRNLRDQLF